MQQVQCKFVSSASWGTLVVLSLALVFWATIVSSFSGLVLLLTMKIWYIFLNTIHFSSFVVYIFIHCLSCIQILWIHLLWLPFCLLSFMGFPCLCKQIHFLGDFKVNLFLALPKRKTWVEFLFFFPMTPGGHPLGITGKKRSWGISIFEMPTLCRGKTLWAIIVCPPITLQKYAQVYVEYVNFSWAYVTLFKSVDQILVNKNVIRIGTIFLCSLIIFSLVDKRSLIFVANCQTFCCT